MRAGLAARGHSHGDSHEKPSEAPESHYNQAPVREPPSALSGSHAKGGTRSASIRSRFSARFKREGVVQE